MSPEWTAYESAWAVEVSDFGGPGPAARFLLQRKRIFAEAEAQGIPRDMMTPFAPDKPGFEDRVRAAFSRIAESADLPAE